MVNLKSGDFVKFNNKVFWVCRCANQPLNYLRNPSCQWCDMLRPTPLAPDVAESEQKVSNIDEDALHMWVYGAPRNAGKA